LLVLNFNSYGNPKILNESVALTKVDSVFGTINVDYIVFVSDNDCMSCLAFISKLLSNQTCQSVVIASNNNFYEYFENLGREVPKNKILKDKELIRLLLQLNSGSLLFYKEQNVVRYAPLNSVEANSTFCVGKKLDRFSGQTLFLPKDIYDVEDFKKYRSYYRSDSDKYYFVDYRYGFSMRFGHDSRLIKVPITIGSEIQNIFFREIESRLNIKNMVYVDTSVGVDANKILSIMGQPKISPLLINEKYTACFLNYVTAKDASNFDIYKAFMILERNGLSFSLVSLLDRLYLNGQHYYIRPNRLKITDSLAIIPYVDTDSIGIPNNQSSIFLAIFALGDTSVNQPINLISTNKVHNGVENLRFTLFDGHVIVFDNLERNYVIYSIKEGPYSTGSYESVGIDYVYDVEFKDKKISVLYNDINGSVISGTASFKTAISIVAREFVNASYLDDAIYNRGFINGHKVDEKENSILIINQSF
jgi:hypothetical protein